VFIRRTQKSYKGKSYTTYLLVESVHTPKGPRQKVICSLGNLAPAPREHWLGLAHKVEAALAGQLPLQEGGDAAQLDSIVKKARRGRSGELRQAMVPPPEAERIIAVDTERVEIEEAREAGPVHVAHQMWRELGLDRILCGVGLSERSRILTEAMVLNRLIFPLSEHAMPEWIRRTALEDILNVDFATLSEDALYRNLDKLHPNRARIEAELAEREKTLFNLEDTVYLYDVTSTYFEGLAPNNSQAKRGYSRDKRPDCKQVLVGLVLNRDGFPKAHEIFDGNRQDRTTVADMLDALEKRTGKRPGATVVVDRGMAYAENLEQIRTRGLHYIVAARQQERAAWLEEFENDEGFEEVIRIPSPRNPDQKKSRVLIKRQEEGEEVYVLCVSEGREEKDRAIRLKHERRLVKDLHALQERIQKGCLKDRDKIHQAIGRLKERYPRVARYYIVDYDTEHKRLSWQEDSARKAIAQKLDGGYVLKTDRRDLSAEEVWRIYVLLTRVEAAFRAMKSPLLERPIFHHLSHRTQTHIFLCVLAYHLLVSIEKRFLDHGIHTSWWTLRQQLSTHQVVTVALPTSSGAILKIRKATNPEPSHREIYSTLGIPQEVIRPLRTWHEADA
jgi:transposase